MADARGRGEPVPGDAEPARVAEEAAPLNPVRPREREHADLHLRLRASPLGRSNGKEENG